MKHLKSILIACAAIFSQAALAQTPLPSSGKEPLEITADGSLEWKRDEKLFIAHDNALARQGDVSVSAATLTAHYREEKAGGGMQISQVDADSNVEIRSRENSAFGQHATYDIDTGKAVMTGDNLKLVSPDQSVTARDRFEYWVTEGRLVAIGAADVTRGTDRLRADQVSAVMKDDPATKKRVLSTMDATGHVVITTPAETVTGDYAIYRADTNKAEMTGNVKITRGPNILQGARAEVDLATNTSRIFGDTAASGATAGKTGQVRAVFYPNSEKKLEEKRVPQ